MGYQYSAAIARAKTLDAEYTAVDLSATPINNIFRLYSKVFLTLTHPALPGPVYLDLFAIRNQIPPSTGEVLLQSWLDSLGNSSLPTQAALPDTTLTPAKYSDVNYAGYTVQPVDYNRNPQSQVPVGARKDLLISKPGLTFQEYWKYCLCTVNGFFHRVGGSREGLYILDGATSGRVANNNHVGLYSFLDVGLLDVIPITPAMIYKIAAEQPLADQAYVKLPYGVAGQTLLLVLGGYLHPMDQLYRMVGDRTLAINFRNYSLAERIFESGKYLDLSSLNLDTPTTNDHQYATEQLFSDATIQAYLTLSQSFLVVLNTPNFYLRKHALERAGYANRYIGRQRLRYPMFGGYGRAFDYVLQPEDGQYVYCVDDARTEQYNFQTGPWQQGMSVDPTRSTIHPWYNSEMYLLEMGKYSSSN